MESTYAVFDPLGGVAGERVTEAACDAFRLGVEGHEDVTHALLRANSVVQVAVDSDATLRGAGCMAGAARSPPRREHHQGPASRGGFEAKAVVSLEGAVRMTTLAVASRIWSPVVEILHLGAAEVR